MSQNKLDIIGIGSAMVDVISYRNDKFIKKHDLHKGATTVLDLKSMQKLYKDMGASTECSGGCCANTIVGLSMLGAETAFICKINNDHSGKIFKKSMERNGVFIKKPAEKLKHQTAKCMIILTEEEEPISKRTIMERTMASYLSTNNELQKSDIIEEDFANAKILFLEGFLFELEQGYQLIKKSVDIAKKHGLRIALSLGDPLFVSRHRQQFLELITNDIDILFCSNNEAGALLKIEEERTLLYKFSLFCKEKNIELAAITRAEKGSFLIHKDEIHTIDAHPVNNIYDVTGAGDLYASGVLYGYLNNMDISKCGQLGSLCAAEVIKYLGARPLTDLKDLLDKL